MPDDSLSPARLETERVHVVNQAAHAIMTSGILNLVRYGEIRFVIVDGSIRQVLIEQSFKPSPAPTFELAPTP